MRRIRRYGKPLPAKRDVRATLKFFELANKGTEMKKKLIEVDAAQMAILKTLCYCEYQKISNEIKHAHSHGDVNYTDNHFLHLANLIQTLEE